MPHPDEGLIHAWLDGALDAAETARVEALVASDPAWSAAAAEARGLIAATARIVGALDRVPSAVIPMPVAPPRHPARRWVWRAAAALALMAGSAVVLERGTPELTAPTPAKSAKPAEPAVQAASPKPAKTAEPAVRAASPTPGAELNAPGSETRSTIVKKELYTAKRPDVLRDKDAAPALGESRANVAAAGAAANTGRRAALAPSAPSPVLAAPAAQGPALEKTTRLQPSCFEQREPRDSAMRIIRLDALALADSIRLERLTLRGDTLAAVNGRLIAVRVRCPQP
jgi:hypothetical protein